MRKMRPARPVGEQGIDHPLDGLAPGLHHLMGDGLIERLAIANERLDARPGIGRAQQRPRGVTTQPMPQILHGGSQIDHMRLLAKHTAVLDRAQRPRP